LAHTPTWVPVDLTVPSNHLLGLQISASFPHMSLFLKKARKSQNIVRYRYLTWLPVIRNVGYDNMGPLRDVEVIHDPPRPAEDFLCQRYDLVTSCHTEKVRNNSFVTHGLLNVRSIVPARIQVRREIDSP
jgi:hypothetical protein